MMRKRSKLRALLRAKRSRFSTKKGVLLFCFFHRFIRVIEAEDEIVEYNQEQCGVMSMDGGRSLIRSFPYASIVAPPVCFEHSLP